MSKLVSTNPSRNYEVIGEVEISSKLEIREAAALAQVAKLQWKETPLSERITILRSVFDLFKDKKNIEKLAKLASQEMGMPFKESREDFMYGNRNLDWYLDHATAYLSPEVTYEDDNEIHAVYREPYGVTAVIVPWNFPFSNFVWQCGQNLIAGNVIVFKGSEEVPLFSKALEEIMLSSLLPKGVFNVIYGDGKVGDQLVHENIDLICFTGSTNTGKYLYKVAAEKFIPVVMELGGSAPGVIFEDADISGVIETIVMNRFMNCGQICDGLKRLIVHKNVYSQVLKQLKEIFENNIIGEAESDKTQMGPLVSQRQLDLLEEQVGDALSKGAKVEIGGKIPKRLKGAYYEPTLLTNVKQNMRVWTEEVFGPVLPIVTFETEEEAVELANDTKYGLGSYVFTSDKERFQRVAMKLQAGMVSLNNTSYVMACNPFGGYKESGLGREHGSYGFHDITQVKVVSREK